MNGLEWFQGYTRHEALHQQRIDKLAYQIPKQVTV